jgi:toxin ParE1/3/4
VSAGYAIRPAADRDIDEIADYLADEAGLETGLRFLSEYYSTLRLLASQPGIGWPCRIANQRLIGVRVFRVSARFRNYLIFYHPLPDRIEIVRVIHGSRDIEALFENEAS